MNLISDLVASEFWLPLILFMPLLVGFLTPLKRVNKVLFYAVAVAICSSMAYGTWLLPPSVEPIRLSEYFVFTLDRTSWIFVILVYLCWSLTLLYSADYVRYQFAEKAERFHRLMSLTITLALGAGTAGNFFTLLFFYLLSIPVIYPLITIRQEPASWEAGKFYLKNTLIPTLLIVVPTVLYAFPLFTPFRQFSVEQLGWSPAQASFFLALLVIGFSKNCVAPFHLWLPRSAVAPAPVTALVHSVAAVQTATIALLKIAKYVYGEEYLAGLSDHIFETGWLIYLCGGTAIYTAYRAWKTPDLKQRFSFSTVGQLSYIMTAILVGSPQATEGATLHIVTHSFAKLNLFFCAGAYLTVFGSFQGPVVAKAIPGQRWLGVAAVISGLSIGGFPFLAGYYSKDLMLIEEIHRHHYSAAAFLILGSVINFVYIWPIIKATFSRRTSETPVSPTVPWTMKAAIVL
jgi:multicomponent Na+:H+ antiporter subunit D